MDWVIDVGRKLEGLDIEVEQEKWKKRSIYTIPAFMTEHNKKAYQPQIVSFGPAHYGEDHLKQMEVHKHRALLHFLNRSRRPLGSLVQELGGRVQELRDYYDWVDPKWNDEQMFLQIMILDGSFMLEILRTCIGMSDGGYKPNDPIFSDHGILHVVPHIRRDMLALQNQLPMLLLILMLRAETGKYPEDEFMHQEDKFLSKIILKFLSPTQHYYPVLGPCLHVLDVYRKSLLRKPPHRHLLRAQHRKSHRKYHPLIYDRKGRSVVGLHKAGIKFKTSKTTSLRDISFDGNSLYLPIMEIDNSTESTFLNLQAFERLHQGVGNDVTSYLFFMGSIVVTAEDVSLLTSSGIMVNNIGSDQAVARIFNALSMDLRMEEDHDFYQVLWQVECFCSRKWAIKAHEWRTNLTDTYFRSPWTIVSLIAAIILMALTSAQTIYTIYPYYHPRDARG